MLKHNSTQIQNQIQRKTLIQKKELVHIKINLSKFNF